MHLETFIADIETPLKVNRSLCVMRFFRRLDASQETHAVIWLFVYFPRVWGESPRTGLAVSCSLGHTGPL